MAFAQGEKQRDDRNQQAGERKNLGRGEIERGNRHQDRDAGEQHAQNHPQRIRGTRRQFPVEDGIVRLHRPRGFTFGPSYCVSIATSRSNGSRRCRSFSCAFVTSR